VVVLDLTAGGRVTSLGRMRDYAGTRAGWAGVEQVRSALRLASERSRSPNESRLRNVLRVVGSLSSLLVNRPVFDQAGRLLGVPDLFDPVAGLVLEYDGAEHRGARRHSRDVRREDGFRRHRLEYVKVTALDMPLPERVVDRVLAGRERAHWLPEGRRSWTLSPPPWWREEVSLDEWLDRRDWLRSEHGQAYGA
jgi:hypothetical protein